MKKTIAAFILISSFSSFADSYSCKIINNGNSSSVVVKLNSEPVIISKTKTSEELSITIYSQVDPEVGTEYGRVLLVGIGDTDAGSFHDKNSKAMALGIWQSKLKLSVNCNKK